MTVTASQAISAITAGTSKSTAVLVKAVPKRWTEENPQTADYYWDEEIPSKLLLKTHDNSHFPPNMDLLAVQGAFVSAKIMPNWPS